MATLIVASLIDTTDLALARTLVESLDDVPPGSTVIFSAHGVARSVRDEVLTLLDDCRSGRVPVDVLLFEDEGHDFVKLANRRLLGDRVVRFCQEVFDGRIG